MQRRAQSRSQHGTRGRQRTVAVKRFVEQLLRQPVNDHGAGAGIEGNHASCPGAWGNRSEVGDAADVLQYSSALLVCEQDIVQKGNERSSLATGQHVGWTEV